MLIESIKTAALVYLIAAIVAILVALYIKLAVYFLHGRKKMNKAALSPAVPKDVPK
jgi:uncharacterized membrane protein (DUF106 family)